MKKRQMYLVAGIIILVIIVAIILFLVFYKKNCGDKSCFEASLKNCQKAVFIDDLQDTTWQYSIKGRTWCFFSKNCNECGVNVELLQVKKGTTDIEKLVGLKMDCYLPLGYVANPQDDLKRCHGLLKEEMQDMIINKMHSYILQNMGQINEELSKVV